jgi:hypothetical protein
MSRRSPRLAAMRATSATEQPQQQPHSERVIHYYVRLLETVYDPSERMDVAISVFEYIFQNWPTLNWSHTDCTERLKTAMTNLEATLPELHDVNLCKKLRLTTLFQELRTLLQ